MRSRIAALTSSLAAALLSACAYAQADLPPQVVLANGGQGQVAVMPRLAVPSAHTQAIEGLQVEVGVESGLLVHRARYRGRTHTAYAQLEGPERHLAFNPQRHRFEEVSSSLLVRLACGPPP